jgi:hypothetical protein
MSGPITVYNVVQTTQHIGIRIEGYTNEHTIFTNKEAALAFAQKLVENIIKEVDEDDDKDEEEVVIDLTEGFKISDGGYDWATHGVYIQELTMDLSKEPILGLKTDDW